MKKTLIFAAGIGAVVLMVTGCQSNKCNRCTTMTHKCKPTCTTTCKATTTYRAQTDYVVAKPCSVCKVSRCTIH